MKNKYLAFAKNVGISSVVGLGMGAGVAELTNLITDKQTVTAITSTVSEYVAAYSIFLPLHARDNRDLYKGDDNRFKWKEFIIDQLKLAGGFVLLDIAYLAGRPLLAKKFLEAGISPSSSSLYADAISYPALIIAALPIAKITGNIRSKKDSTLENKVK